MAAKLGDFLVNITTEADDKGLKNYAKTLFKVSKSAGKLGAGITASLGAAGFGFAKFITGVASDTAELGRLAEDLGVSTNALESFSRAFDVVGAGAGTAVDTIRTLTKEVEAFKLGRGNIEEFGILGFSPQQFGDDALENFDVIREKFNQLDKAQQLYFVTQIGLSEKSLRVLRLNRKEYSELLKTSNQAPLATKQQIASSERYERNIKRLGQSFTSFKRELVSGVTPAFVKFTDGLTKLFSNKGFQKDISSVFKGLFEDTLPAIIEATPKIVDQIETLTTAIADLAKVSKDVSDSKLFKAIGFVLKGPELLGGVAADIIDAQIEAALANRGENVINPKTGRISSQLGSATKSELVNNASFGRNQAIVQGVERFNNQPSSSGNSFSNTITINVSKTNATSEDIGKAAEAAIRRANKEASDNLKAGIIQ